MGQAQGSKFDKGLGSAGENVVVLFKKLFKVQKVSTIARCLCKRHRYRQTNKSVLSAENVESCVVSTTHSAELRYNADAQNRI